MANASGSRAPGAGRRAPTGSRCKTAPVPTPAPAPPYKVVRIPLLDFLSRGPGKAELKAAPLQGTNGVGGGSSSQKAFTNLALDSDTAAQSGDKVLTAPLPRGTNDFPHTALHMVPLASWASINPFLSREPAFGVRGTLSSLGEVQSPPSQPLLHHSPVLHRDFWLLLRSTLPSFSARFTLLRHL
ncbi:uncharacterized protein ACIBXB_021891 isoform 1-T1 [Morphnus guianensis]